MEQRKFVSPEDVELQIKSLSFFTEFPQEFIGKLINASYFKSFEVGDEVLTQGQTNTDLYFLLLGKISVHVDGKLVAQLDQKGELIGEMSVITEKPCSATIKADTPVKTLVVDSESLMQLLDAEKEVFQHLLYRAYSVVLSGKLNSTNQKAKFFEEVSSNAMKEVHATHNLTFQKLELVKDKNLPALLKELKALKTQTPGSAVDSALQELDKVSQIIEPMVKQFEVDQSMKSKKVLLAETDRKQQTTAKLAMGGTGVSMDIAKDADELKESLSREEPDIIMVSADLLDIVKDRVSQSGYPKIVLMTSDEIANNFDILNNLTVLPNIVSRDEEDRTFTIKNIMTTISKLASGDIFGLEKYLAWGVEVQEQAITGSAIRHDLNEEMSAYFKQLGVRTSRLSNCSAVAEELMMNAVYDAPTDSEGQSIYNHMSRQEVIELAPEHQSKLRYAMDGMILAVSVDDPFGALEGATILKYLESCYQGRAGELNKNKGGAGRGLHLIVEQSDLVVFNIDPKKRTEVIALFNVDPKTSADRATSFHYFSV